MDIRKLLDIVTESKKNVKPVFEGMRVMSLPQFLDVEGVESSKGTSGEEELDEIKKLSGVTARPFGKDELQSYLGRIEKKAKEKGEKFKLPYIHRSNVVPIINDEGKEYDLKKLAAQITQRPKKILKQNEKMKHSDGSATIYFNIGLPALKGLAFDEDAGEFVIIDTCPGAGQCKTYCFAMKGGYVMFKAPSMIQTQLLNWLYNDPSGFMSQLSAEISEKEKKYNKKNTKVAIRWHDAGDFFSPEYLERAYDLASSHPKTDFYAYTKIASVAKADRPDNFKINFSMGALPAQEKEIDFAKTKNSRVVPEALFKDLVERIPDPEGKPDKKGKVPTKLVYKDTPSLNSLKQRLAAKYSVDPKTIITYDEMMKTPVSKEKNKYNVIVKPGDGDESANRADVLNTFLLMH